MELHQLRYFVAVAETGSFTRGAARCHVAQPSLSQQIQKLEQACGQKLFDRLGRRIALTQAGESLLPHARQVLAAVEQAAASVRDDTAGGPLVVGAIPTIAPYLLPGVIRRFLKAHPDCDLSLREDLTERLIEAVADCRIDLAVMSTPVEHPLIDVEVIGTEPLLVALPARHRLCDRRKLKLSDVTGERAIVLHEMHCLGRQIQAFCTSNRIEQRLVCQSTQLETVKRMVALGLGVSVLPAMAVDRAGTSSALRVLPVEPTGPTRQIAIIWRKGRSRRRLETTLSRMLGDELGNG